MKTAADGDDYTWGGGAVLNEATQYSLVAVDLRTPDQREREDVAALHLRVDNLVDALEAMGRRVAALERAARSFSQGMRGRK